MGCRKQKKSTQKSLHTPGTSNALCAQPSASVANATIPGKKRSNPNAEEITAAKWSRGQRLKKKDVPKLLKKVMEALEDTDSESDGELHGDSHDGGSTGDSR